MQRKLVALAGRTREAHGLCEIPAAAARVITTEIHRLADLRDRIGHGLTGFAHRKRHEHRHVPFHQLRRTFQGKGPFLRIGSAPGRCCVGGACHGHVHLCGIRRDDGAHLASPIGRIQNRLPFAFLIYAADERRGTPIALQRFAHVRIQRLQFRRIGNIDAARIAALRLVDIRRGGDARVGFDREALHLLQRIGDDVVHRCAFVDDAIDERSVGAVLQQSPYQVGQQVFMAAYRCVNTAGERLTIASHHLLVEGLAHSVQTLKLVVPALSGHLHDGRQGVGVVGGELGKECIAMSENPARAGDV